MNEVISNYEAPADDNILRKKYTFKETRTVDMCKVLKEQ